MKEVKKCSISGIAFTFDSDAYDTLSQYIETLQSTYENTDDGREIVADIEARIAELILSTQDNARVVEKPLVDNIIKQMGSVRDISAEADEVPHPGDAERIPRRLYRDPENAKLGGVCAGIAKYFDLDPSWVRVGMFVPLILVIFSSLPFMWWIGQLMGNIFGLIMICYLVMWFAVPAARTPRQKLEMNGTKITVQSIRETAAASRDADSKARPMVARAVYALGQVILILLKIFAGVLVLGLILLACALVVGLFAVSITGTGYVHGLGVMANMGVWFPILAIVAVFIPVMLLVYVLMCLIASRKPNGRIVLVTFILWVLSIIAVSISGFSNYNRLEIFNSVRHMDIMSEPVVIDVDSMASVEVMDQDSLKSFELKVNDKKVFDVQVSDKKVTATIDGN